jgi:hypothetical protein
VAGDHPDIVQRLQGLADGMAAELGQDGKIGPGVRPPGKVDHPVMLFPTKAKNVVIDYE